MLIIFYSILDETVEPEGDNELMFLDQGLGPDRDFDSFLIIPGENLDQRFNSG